MPNNRGNPVREHFSARLLRLYLFYRFFLSLLLLGVHAGQIAPSITGSHNPGLYLSTAIIYVVLSTITLGFFQLQKHRLTEPQLLLTLISDMAIQTLLMYCSGGLESGIGYLMIVTVAAGAIFFTGQLAILIPAIGSICIILESVLAAMFFDRSTAGILPSGLLGIFLFLTALLFSRLSKALVVAQQIAETESEVSAGLQELNQMIINRMRTGIIVVDQHFQIQQINRAARELLGHHPERKPIAIGDSIQGEPRLLKRLHDWRSLPGIKTEPFVSRFGNTELQATFATLEQSDSQSAIVFLEDFRAAAQEAQQLKLASLGRLTGSIAHEIRNPLGAISHASELLSELRDDNRTSTRLTEIIETQVKRVNHIVESVLQLSRQERHNPGKIDIGPWLTEFLQQFLQGKRDSPEIALNLGLDIADSVTFDPVHLQQILTNLLDNALRYSTELTGTAWAAITVNRQPGEQSLTLDVVDRGAGIPPEHRGKLFEPFFTTSPGGSGLGLFIARELCAINYATIKYQPPEPGKNSYFRITFIHPEKILTVSEAPHDTP